MQILQAVQPDETYLVTSNKVPSFLGLRLVFIQVAREGVSKENSAFKPKKVIV